MHLTLEAGSSKLDLLTKWLRWMRERCYPKTDATCFVLLGLQGPCCAMRFEEKARRLSLRITPRDRQCCNPALVRYQPIYYALLI